MQRVLIWAMVAASTTALARGADDLLIADFEGNSYGDWKIEGEAFGQEPAGGTLEAQQQVSGFLGQGLVNTYLRGDGTQGTLTSPEFTIQRPYLNFLVGGGKHPERTCIELIVDRKIMRSTTGLDNERLDWATWDVKLLLGKSAQLQIVDRQTDGWGHINIDHIVQSDTAKRAPDGDVVSKRELREKLEKRLRPILDNLDFEEIVFAVRQNGKDGHWYANFSYWSDRPERSMYSDHGKLCALNVKTGEARVILDAPDGGVRDPHMHYDGQKILFSYRKDGQPYYHLYEINVDGSGLRQLTDGPFDDLEPAYLPDGGIVFCSSRCNRMVQCFFVRVATVHRCDGDGQNIRALSANMEQDNTPWVLPDGRILYQRWEYIDRSQVQFHHLWTMNPDGTNQQVFFGNMHGGTVMIDAKPIPGTQKVLASFSPGHGRPEHMGHVTIVDPVEGPDARENARQISDEAIYRDPYPLSEELFIAADQRDIVMMDDRGSVMTIYELPEEWSQGGVTLHEPRPIKGRARERVIPTRIIPEQATGQVFLENVYIGRNMGGIEPGEIKKLLVLEVLPKPVNFSGGQEPLTIGGSFTLERVLGTVPVEPDGSANFELPAMRSLFFVALDENDMSVKRMQSFMTVQPGEIVSCVGCHEERLGTPRSFTRTTAMNRAPSRIEPIAGVPDVYDFPRDIQPILDKHCVGCHDYEKTEQGGPRAGGVILSGDHGPQYSHSYATLTQRGEFSDGRNGGGNRAPHSIGSSASPLLKKLDGIHRNPDLDVPINATDREKTIVRLWIELGAPYPGTYAALGCGMVGAPEQNGAFQEVLDRRCTKCHEKPKLDQRTACNLSRPELSYVLLKALARDAGGYGMVKKVEKDGQQTEQIVHAFKDTKDPDYQVMLDAIRREGQRLEEIKRFDMPGFRPNEHYIREMKVYGILPKSFGPDDPIDAYEIDEKYWRSHWYATPTASHQD
ncbi:MAG: hypothetical protein V3R99_05460 [Thermoguttaceae bacterium]